MSLVSKFKNIGKLLFNSDYRFNFLSDIGFHKYVSDEKVIKRKYKIKTGKELNLNSPKTFTEKLQWLKLYDRRPEYTVMVDKYLVKNYVSERIGEKYIIPVYGVWDRFDDIDFSTLPDKFVLKCTHDSGSYAICKNKADFNFEAAKKLLKKRLKRQYFVCSREWPYKNVKPRIIAEAYMEDSKYKELRDYKFFTFGGEPKALYIVQGRGKGETTVADFFDMDFNHLPITFDHNMAEVPPVKPECFEEMKRLAAILSKGTPQLRVDFYEVDGKVYFGEMTFFHCSGFGSFNPDYWDKTFGDWIVLPQKSTAQ